MEYGQRVGDRSERTLGRADKFTALTAVQANGVGVNLVGRDRRERPDGVRRER
jgi:hypothetical protein